MGIAKKIILILSFTFICVFLFIYTVVFSNNEQRWRHVSSEVYSHGLITHNTSVTTSTLSSSGQPQFIDLTSGRDILVFIHVQKTGGSSFLSHLTTIRTNEGIELCSEPNEQLKNALRRKKPFMVCPLVHHNRQPELVLPEMWLASERTYGWWCGVHPFLFEMKSCLDSKLRARYGTMVRSYHYITILRHPVLRYLSEFLHVSRGATWSKRRHVCNGQPMEPSPCYQGYYSGAPWNNVTLDKFVRCSSNWANNRQTIMLANLTEVNCFNDQSLSSAERNRILLASAKENLRKMPFFGLSEYFVESCRLFEHQFKVKFVKRCIQKEISTQLHSSPMLHTIWTNTALYNSIINSNDLDMQLYQYALQLLTVRLEKYGISINANKVDNEVLNYST